MLHVPSTEYIIHFSLHSTFSNSIICDILSVSPPILEDHPFYEDRLPLVLRSAYKIFHMWIVIYFVVVIVIFDHHPGYIERMIFIGHQLSIQTPTTAIEITIVQWFINLTVDYLRGCGVWSEIRRHYTWLSFEFF